jgi:hypothetical protein
MLHTRRKNTASSGSAQHVLYLGMVEVIVSCCLNLNALAWIRIDMTEVRGSNRCMQARVERLLPTKQ